MTVPVTVLAATRLDPPVAFSLVLSNPQHATLGNTTATITLDRSQVAVLPAVSIAGMTVTQPTSGTVTAKVKVTLSRASSKPVTVKYATADGTPRMAWTTSRSRGRRRSRQGRLGVHSGDRLADTDPDPPRDFTVTLSNPHNATIDTAVATITLLSSVLPAASIADLSITQLPDRNIIAHVQVTLSGATDQAVHLDYVTADQSAHHDVDYQATSGTLTIPAGAVAVDPGHDLRLARCACTQKVHGALTNPVHATISRAVSTVTISSGYDPTMSTSDAVGTQPVTGTAKVNVLVDMGYPADQPVTAHYATNDGTAQAGRDYTATSGTVTIRPGIPPPWCRSP